MRPAALWAAARQWYASHSQRDQRVLFGVGVACVLSLIYVAVVQPVRAHRQAVNEEIGDGQDRLERDARFVGRVDALRAERDELRKKLEQVKGRLLPGGSSTLGSAALQERANSIAVEKGIPVQSTQVMKDEAADPYRKVSVRLTLSGELKPFAELVSALEYGQQLVIPFVEMTRRGAVVGAKGPRTIQATVEVAGFVIDKMKAEGQPTADGVEAEGEAGAPGAGEGERGEGAADAGGPEGAPGEEGVPPARGPAGELQEGPVVNGLPPPLAPPGMPSPMLPGPNAGGPTDAWPLKLGPGAPPALAPQVAGPTAPDAMPAKPPPAEAPQAPAGVAPKPPAGAPPSPPPGGPAAAPAPPAATNAPAPAPEAG